MMSGARYVMREIDTDDGSSRQARSGALMASDACHVPRRHTSWQYFSPFATPRHVYATMIADYFTLEAVCYVDALRFCQLFLPPFTPYERYH